MRLIAVPAAFAVSVLALTSAVPASASTTSSASHHVAASGMQQKWTDKLGCHFMATIPGVGERSVTAYMNTDSCHTRTPMHAWTECGSGKIAIGINRTSSQGKSSKAVCGFSVFPFLYKWGVQSYQYAQKPNHRYYRLWVTHVFGCNGGC